MAVGGHLAPTRRPARTRARIGQDDPSGLCRLACDPLRGNAILPWLSPFHRQCRGGKETHGDLGRDAGRGRRTGS